METDSSVTSFGFAQDLESTDYLFIEGRDNFKSYCEINIEEEFSRTEIHSVTLRLLKIILEKGSRKWEFVWNGIKISAPITDDNFWEDLRTGKVQISHGDSMDVQLKIHQKKDPYADVFLNDKYEVVRVDKYHKALKQKDDFFDSE